MKKNLFSAIILLLCSLFLVSCTNPSENIPEGEYTITYVSMVNGTQIDSVCVTKDNKEKSVFSAQNIVGYKFVGWQDGEKSIRRTDNYLSEETIIANYQMEFLELPVFVINTEDSKDVTSRLNYLDCTISLLNTKEEYTIDSASAQIRGRGNSTWSYDKKPYRIKFDSKTSLFGSAEGHKSWTLLANYTDQTLSRNALAYEMAQNFDGLDVSSQNQFVEVYLNNEYKGVYLLCDQVQTGTGRVDVDETYYEDGDNGYLLELDIFAYREGVENVDYFKVNGDSYTIKTPDTESTEYNAGVCVSYIKNYLEQTFSVLEQGTFLDVEQYLDVDSFVDAYIITELFANPDCGYSSFYIYKDRGGVLYCGPLWDFDISAGNHYGFMDSDNLWHADFGLLAKTDNSWFSALFNHSEFLEKVKARLVENETTIKNVIELANPDNPNGYYALYEKAIERNFEVWDVLGKRIGFNPDGFENFNTVYEHIQYLYNWLTLRYDYLVETL